MYCTVHLGIAFQTWGYLGTMVRWMGLYMYTHMWWPRDISPKVHTSRIEIPGILPTGTRTLYVPSTCLGSRLWIPRSFPRHLERSAGTRPGYIRRKGRFRDRFCSLSISDLTVPVDKSLLFSRRRVHCSGLQGRRTEASDYKHVGLWGTPCDMHDDTAAQTIRLKVDGPDDG